MRRPPANAKERHEHASRAPLVPPPPLPVRDFTGRRLPRSATAREHGSQTPQRASGACTWGGDNMWDSDDSDAAMPIEEDCDGSSRVARPRTLAPAKHAALPPSYDSCARPSSPYRARSPALSSVSPPPPSTRRHSTARIAVGSEAALYGKTSAAGVQWGRADTVHMGIYAENIGAGGHWISGRGSRPGHSPADGWFSKDGFEAWTRAAGQWA